MKQLAFLFLALIPFSLTSCGGGDTHEALADQTNYPVLFDAVSAKKLRPKLTKEDF